MKTTYWFFVLVFVVAAGCGLSRSPRTAGGRWPSNYVETGKYVIDSVYGRRENLSEVSFEGVHGTFSLLSDTLKKWDTITVISLKRKRWN